MDARRNIFWKLVLLMIATKRPSEAMALDALKVQKGVSTYYGETLQGSKDLKTNACCTGAAMPAHLKAALSNVHPEVVSRYYGCGLCVPDELTGLSVLDLGCGAGRDVFLISQMVGESGRVVGVDMTKAQIEVAREHAGWHAEKFGYVSPNTEFVDGVIEDLGACGLEDETFDLIVSNCVINLATDKKAVLRDAFRVLKEGGELYFSDVYASRRVPEELIKDPVLYGECLSGALYWNDFINLAKECGFSDPRLVEDAPITINNKELEAKVGRLDFYSATYRLFKLPVLEPDCEDYGQAVVYKGTIPRHPNAWSLDDHHTMETGKVFPVCGNTYHMLHDSRFRQHFDYLGDKSMHFGIFEGCGKSLPYASATPAGSTKGAACC
jgi:SAM-dependent methyltransferase